MVGTWGKGFPVVCGKTQFAHLDLIVASTVETIQRPSASIWQPSKCSRRIDKQSDTSQYHLKNPPLD